MESIRLDRNEPLAAKPYPTERLKFFSRKWLHRALYSINANEEFRRAAAGKSLRANFVVDEAPHWAPPVFYMIAVDGWLEEAGFGQIEEAFAARADYETWVGLVTKELDPLRALVARKIRVDQLLRLMPMQDAFMALVRATRDDPVEY